MFAETVHVVAARHGFACVMVIPRRSYIFQVSSKSVQGFWSHGWFDIWPFPLFAYWLLQQLVGTAVHAVIPGAHSYRQE